MFLDETTCIIIRQKRIDRISSYSIVSMQVLVFHDERVSKTNLFHQLTLIFAMATDDTLNVLKSECLSKVWRAALRIALDDNRVS